MAAVCERLVVASCAIMGLVYAAPRASAVPESVNLIFLPTDGIDKRNFGDRNPTKPFYFNLLSGPGRSGEILKFPFTVDIGTEFDVWFDKRIPEPGATSSNSSLGMRITSEVNENAKDKIMLSVHSSDRSMSVDDAGDHYFGFDFMLDRNYETPKDWTIHVQAWQCCGGHPPFTISVRPSADKASNVTMVFAAKDDWLESKHREMELFEVGVQRERWNDIVMKLNPTSDANPALGSIEMWLDGRKAFSKQCHWGYAPAQLSNGHRITNAIGLDIGIYRRRQATTQTIYFANIRSGTSLDSVLTTRPR